MSVSDLALNRSFIHWVRNRDPETEEFWTTWLLHNPEMEETVDAARDLVLALDFHGECLSSQQVDKEWKDLHESINPLPVSSGKGTRTIHRFSRRSFLSVAATLLFLTTFTLMTWLLVNRFTTSDQGIALIKKTTLPGQKVLLTLSDGTKIKLNADSEIQFPEQFPEGERAVFLKGEAFFDVTHNSRAPFKVHTGGIAVVVLGTSFNVNAYPEDEDVQVALEEGKVSIHLTDDPDGKENILLSPSEVIQINKDNYRYDVQHFDPQETTAWKDGCLYLGNAGFDEITVKLERWFGVTFEMDPGFKVDPDWTFKGKFRDKSLSYILSTLSYPDLFKYRIEEGKVIIYQKDDL